MTSNFTSSFLLSIISENYLLPLSFSFLIGIALTSIAFFIYKKYKTTEFKSLHSTAESILDESEQLNLLINNIPDGVFIKDSSRKFILCNRIFADQIKIDSPLDICGKTDIDIYPADFAAENMQLDQKILEGIIPSVNRIDKSENEGRNKIISVSKTPIRNKKGKIIGLLGITCDITEKETSAQQVEQKNLALEKERTLFRAIMDNMPDTIYIKDLECKFLDGNPSQINVTKAGSHENLLGKSDFDFYPRDIAEIFYKDDKHVLETGKAVINKEEIGFDADGNIRVKSTTKVPFKDQDGNIIGLVGIGRNITKQKEAEEKLKEQSQSLQEVNVLLEERQEEINQQSDELSAQNSILEDERNLLRTLIDSIPEYIYLKDADSKFITINKRMMEVFKTDNLDDIIGKTDSDFYPEDFASKFLKDDQSVISSGKGIYDKEEPGFDSNGNFIHLLTSKVPFKNPEGEIAGIIGITRDVTKIKEAELKLKEQAEDVKEANTLLEERQEEIQQQSSELTSQNRVLENERNLLRTLIDTIPDLIYIKDNDSKFIACNKKVLEIMKALDFDHLEGKTDFDFYPRKIAEIYHNDEQKIIKTKESLINKEEIGFDIEGNERVIATTKVPYLDADGNVAGIVGVGRDITEMKEYEKTLQNQAENLQENNNLLEERQEEIQKQSETLSEQNILLESERNLLRTLIDNMPDYIYIKDKESRFLTVNRRLLKVMQTDSLDDVIGKTDYDSAPSKEAADAYFQDEQNIIKTGKPLINKEEIGFDEKLRERVISTTKVPYKDIDGTIIGIVGIGRDITKQKKAEKQLREQAQNLQEVNVILEERQEKIQQQSEEINKQSQILKKNNTQLEQLNATKNKFFSIIAHDLKNPFQAIFGFSELLLRNFDDFDNPQKMELLGMIKSSSESAYNLLENLLQWARTQTERIKYNPANINLGELIEQNITLSEPNAENKHITLVSEINCSNPAFADKNMINLIIRNLISNAIKFTNDGGIITVQCSSDEKEKGMLAVSIADTGIGISTDNIEKLFHIDEYFSTSGTAGEIGTGLGLIICKEFVEKNKGSIYAQSELNIGTTFTFTLPLGKK